MFVPSRETVRQALALASEGRNACQISRQIGVPASTISKWLRGAVPRRRRRYADLSLDELLETQAATYAYVLALYLGDGHVARMPRTYCLRICLDSAYQGIIDQAASAIDVLLPSGLAGKYPRARSNCCDVVSYSRHWPKLLPQHGPGLKHLRDVSLLSWQLAITAQHPREFLRGLIHSDGSRYTANQRTGTRIYSYPRYFFGNESADILRMFCDHLDLLDIAWTQPRYNGIQIARREAVAQMDSFIGPKR
jgi:hypothetical protein